MTLEIIKKTDPGVYDEMINDTLSLIRKALSSSILSVVDRMVKLEVEAEREACAKVCEEEASRAKWNWDNDISGNQPFWNGGEQLASSCAAAIRARREQ